MKPVLVIIFLLSSCSLKAQTDSIVKPQFDSAIYRSPEIEPEYPGGSDAWARYLSQNLKYPKQAKRNNVQGTVVIQFWVDREGFSHEVTAISGPEELRKESIRLVKNVGRWVSGIYYSKRVNAWKLKSVVFKLENQN
jgi:periplasmic protein TonB